jgi:non-specific serine/threonine protein kinase
VRQLDGLPLAIELAAARMQVLPLRIVSQRLDRRLQTLGWDAQDLPGRQRSLQAAIGWSYELLTEEEQRLFRLLGVYAGQVSVEAMTAVSGAGDAEATLLTMISLAEKSLVLPGPPDDVEAEPVFGVLETVRQYAWEQLEAQGEQDAARRAHAAFVVELAERAEPEVYGPHQRAWCLRLEREQDNVRAALRWLLEQEDVVERAAGLRLAAALGWFWYVRGHHGEGAHWLQAALARASLADAGEAVDAGARLRVLLGLGLLLFHAVAQARPVVEEALALAERWQDRAGIAWAHTELGLCVAFAGNVDEGLRLLHDGHRRFEELSDLHGLANTYAGLGIAAELGGDATAAAAFFAAALQQFGISGDAQTAGYTHCLFGALAGRQGEHTLAVQHVRTALQTSIELQNGWLLCYGVQAALGLAEAPADPQERMRLLGATETILQAAGAALNTNFVWERLQAVWRVAEPREQLARGEGELAAAYRTGRALPLGEVVALALRLLDELAPPAADETALRLTAPSLLTSREQEVLRLVAEGLTSKQIGQQLFVSPRTVDHHLTAIFSKLGVETRAQAVAVATRDSLI